MGEIQKQVIDLYRCWLSRNGENRRELSNSGGIDPINSRLDQQCEKASERLAGADRANKIEQQRELEPCLHHVSEKCRPGRRTTARAEMELLLELAQPSPMPGKEQ